MIQIKPTTYTPGLDLEPAERAEAKRADNLYLIEDDGELVFLVGSVNYSVIITDVIYVWAKMFKRPSFQQLRELHKVAQQKLADYAIVTARVDNDVSEKFIHFLGFYESPELGERTFTWSAIK